MKKSLIALALAAAVPTLAQAQASNVIMYGKVDLGVVKYTGFNNGNLSISQGNGSRFGVRGSEDLGGGLRANFTIEHRFNADTGTVSSNNFWQGRSIVGLSGGFGAIQLGRDYTPSFWVALASDPWGWSYIRAGDGLSVDYTHGNAGAVRFANSIQYTTPDLGGLKAQVMVGMKESSVAGAGNNLGFNLVYAAGPVYLGYALQKNKSSQPSYAATTAGAVSVSTNGATTVAAANSTVNVLTGSYNLGFAKAILGFNTGKTAAGKTKNFSLGATAPIGAGELRVAFAKADAPGKNVAGDKKIFGIGYGYNLSNRTELYTDLSSEKFDASVAGNNGGLVKKKTSIDFGVNHNF